MKCGSCGNVIIPPWCPPYDDRVYIKAVEGYIIKVCKECYREIQKEVE